MAGFFSKLLGKPESPEETPGATPADPFDADLGPGKPGDAVVHQVVAVLLCYPDAAMIEALPEVRALIAAAEDPELEAAAAPVLAWLTARPLAEVQADYVQEFDLSRRHSLNLSYWTDGDTRRRGAALGRFKQVYRDSEMVTDLHGELPDYLPMVLEFAAQADPVRGRAVLQAYRPSLELLRLACRDGGLPHEGLVEAVCRTLPGPSPQTHQQIQEMAGYGPPQESVGLGHDDPRLLPVVQSFGSQEPDHGGLAPVPSAPLSAPDATHESMSGARR